MRHVSYIQQEVGSERAGVPHQALGKLSYSYSYSYSYSVLGAGQLIQALGGHDRMVRPRQVDHAAATGTVRPFPRWWPSRRLLYLAGLCSRRPGQTCVSMPLGHRTTGGQGVVGSNPAVPTQTKP